MKKTLVKICGITNVEDARWAANLGADYVGLNFCAESKRKVSVDRAQEIAESLPPFVKSVGVFVNPKLAEVQKILGAVKLSVLQLHGDEDPGTIEELKSNFPVMIWKAFRVENEMSLEKITGFVGAADMFLLDAFTTDQKGGSGESFDWNLATKAKEYGIPIFLAGGLTPENVADAVKKVRPEGVDVASGVEKEGHPRKKDTEKMKLFIQKAKGNG